MKFTTYEINFGHTIIEVRALNREDAKILARAQMISKGLVHKIVRVKVIN